MVSVTLSCQTSNPQPSDRLHLFIAHSVTQNPQLLGAVCCALPLHGLRATGIEAALGDVAASWGIDRSGDRTSPAAIRYSRQLASLLDAAIQSARAAAAARAASAVHPAPPAAAQPPPAKTATPPASPARPKPAFFTGLSAPAPSPAAAAAAKRNEAEAAESNCLILIELLLQEMLKLGRGMLVDSSADGGGGGGGSGSGSGSGGHPFADLLQARLALLAAAAWRAERSDYNAQPDKQADDDDGAVIVIDDSMDEGNEAAGGGLGRRLLGLCWENLFDKPVQVGVAGFAFESEVVVDS